MRVPFEAIPHKLPARNQDEGDGERKHDAGLNLPEAGVVLQVALRLRIFFVVVDAVELFDQLNMLWAKGISIVHLANVSLGLGDPNQARQWLDTALPLMRQSGDLWNMAFTLNNYGEVARVLGDYDQAEIYYRQTEELYTQADAKGDQARLVHTFGYIAMHKGNYDEAQTFFLKGLEDFIKLGNHRGIAECLAGIAGLATVQGKHAWAAPLLAAAEHQLHSFGGDWWPADRVEIDRALESMRSALGDNFDTLWKQGSTMKVDDAIDYAYADHSGVLS